MIGIINKQKSFLMEQPHPSSLVQIQTWSWMTIREIVIGAYKSAKILIGYTKKEVLFIFFICGLSFI
jgi:hypothetical protein